MNEEFWNASWDAIDLARVEAYLNREEEADPLLEELQKQHVRTVCDAGCGCGAFALRLIRQGFAVSGFDVSGRAVEIAETLLQKAGKHAALKTVSILATGYEDDTFDAVVSRDVLDHMAKTDAVLVVRELLRIVKPGGVVLFTLDALDEEYQNEAHVVTEAGDYVFTAGKWEGMTFHPYSREEAAEIAAGRGEVQIRELPDGLLVCLKKPERKTK